MSRWMLLLPLFLLPAIAGASGMDDLTGVVRGEDGVPVAQVEVVVLGASTGTLTRGDGTFVLRGLPPGRHRVQFSRIGFAPVVREVETGGAGMVALEVVLTATPLTLSGVQVTGRPGSREALSGTQATTQLHGRALERSLSGSVAETLAESPGIAVRNNGPGAAMPIVRGLTGDRVLLLQDGQRMADLAGAADDHGMTIDPLAAQRIEVVRGPAALIYGNNALGGVVNVITGEPPAHLPPGGEWRASLQGETGYPGGAAMLRGVLPLSDRWALGVRGNVRGAGDMRVGADPGVGTRLSNTDRRTAEGSTGLAYLGRTASAGVSLRAHGFEYGLPIPPGDEDEIRLAGRIAAVTAQTRMVLPSFVLSDVRATASYQDYAHEEREHGEVEMAFGLRTLTGDVTVSQAPVGILSEGTWGVSVLRREYVATGEEQLTAPATSLGVGLFGYQEIAPAGSPATLQIGGRLDHLGIASLDAPRFGPGVERSFPALSGSTGVNVRLSPGLAAAANVASAFRAPTVEELFSDALHVGVAAYEVGDPTLRAERAVGLEALLRAEAPRLGGMVALHRNRIADFVHLEERGDTVIDGTRWPVMAYVQGDAVLTGVDAEGQWLVARRFVVGWSGDIVRGRLLDGELLPFMPAPRLGASLRWDDGRSSLGASARHAFAQGRVGLEDEHPTTAYTLLGVDASTRFSRGGGTHSVSVRVNNLTDAAYRDAASRIKSFAPGPGRNVSVVYSVYF